LREALDIASMDFLNLVTALHNRLGAQSRRRITPNFRRSAAPSIISPRRSRLQPDEQVLITRAWGATVETFWR
jgi:hypothetical protein